MKPSEVQKYFEEKLAALGLRQHASAFARDNVPATLADLTYSFEMGQSQVSAANQVSSKFVMPVTLNIYFKDYRTQTDLRMAALAKMEQIFGLILKPRRSLGDGGFSIQPSGVAVDVLSQQNLACGVMKLDFTVSMFLNFRGLL